MTANATKRRALRRALVEAVTLDDDFRQAAQKNQVAQKMFRALYDEMQDDIRHGRDQTAIRAAYDAMHHWVAERSKRLLDAESALLTALGEVQS